MEIAKRGVRRCIATHAHTQTYSLTHTLTHTHTNIPIPRRAAVWAERRASRFPGRRGARGRGQAKCMEGRVKPAA